MTNLVGGAVGRATAAGLVAGALRIGLLLQVGVYKTEGLKVGAR